MLAQSLWHFAPERRAPLCIEFLQCACALVRVSELKTDKSKQKQDFQQGKGGKQNRRMPGGAQQGLWETAIEEKNIANIYLQSCM